MVVGWLGWGEGGGEGATFVGRGDIGLRLGEVDGQRVLC